MIAGLEDISAGELKIGDLVVNDMEPKDRDIAMVFQNYALNQINKAVIGIETTTAAAQNIGKYPSCPISVALSSQDFIPTATVNLSSLPSIMNDENIYSPQGAMNAVKIV